jgi:hypothetical protein
MPLSRCSTRGMYVSVDSDLVPPLAVERLVRTCPQAPIYLFIAPPGRVLTGRAARIGADRRNYRRGRVRVTECPVAADFLRGVTPSGPPSGGSCPMYRPGGDYSVHRAASSMDLRKRRLGANSLAGRATPLATAALGLALIGAPQADLRLPLRLPQRIQPAASQGRASRRASASAPTLPAPISCHSSAPTKDSPTQTDRQSRLPCQVPDPGLGEHRRHSLGPPADGGRLRPLVMPAAPHSSPGVPPARLNIFKPKCFAPCKH